MQRSDLTLDGRRRRACPIGGRFLSLGCIERDKEKKKNKEETRYVGDAAHNDLHALGVTRGSFEVGRLDIIKHLRYLVIGYVRSTPITTHIAQNASAKLHSRDRLEGVNSHETPHSQRRTRRLYERYASPNLPSR